MNVLSRSLYIIIKIWCAIIDSAFKFSASRSSLILKPCLTWFWPCDSVKTKIITFHKYLNFSFLCNDFQKKKNLSKCWNFMSNDKNSSFHFAVSSKNWWKQLDCYFWKFQNTSLFLADHVFWHQKMCTSNNLIT